jgi:hypothetical protein
MAVMCHSSGIHAMVHHRCGARPPRDSAQFGSLASLDHPVVLAVQQLATQESDVIPNYCLSGVPNRRVGQHKTDDTDHRESLRALFSEERPTSSEIAGIPFVEQRKHPSHLALFVEGHSHEYRMRGLRVLESNCFVGFI